ncbi:MAG TPA: alanine racemase [Steroidobacteraceae bacterium]|nr:alanine racemase [Steroidobacteraceae bacterium]HRX90472.1 alanine racemase [Steroidobacteraceae bacterium]
MTRLIRAIVDTAALRNNLNVLRTAAGGAKVMAVVKANAYGHGVVPVAAALADADSFAVARLEEGLTLRAAGISAPIVLLEGVPDAEQLAEAVHHGFELVIHDASQLAMLESSRVALRAPLWLKIDTGMNRLGFRPDTFADTWRRLRALRSQPLEIRALTHLARADERQSPMTREQVARFHAALASAGLSASAALSDAQRIVTSIGNSAGTLGWPEARSDWVRPGLSLYGVSPFPGEPAAKFGLRPVMTFETTVIAVRRVLQGEVVGYGGTWSAACDSTVAILAAGYGDGLLRSLRQGTPVLLRGARAALVGRVSMDMVAVDVSNVPGVAVGDKAILWGADLPVEEIAEFGGTIAYELLCGVRQRVPIELR